MNMKKVSNRNSYECSNGKKVSQQYINRKLRETYQQMSYKASMLCECCMEEIAVDHDHTIAQRRCKELHKTELIWDERNIVLSCRDCHTEWENYKSALYEEHLNADKRLAFVAKHDPEGIRKRMVHLNDYLLMKSVNNLID